MPAPAPFRQPEETKPVIAYVMHEEDQKVVHQILSRAGRLQIEATRSMVSGEATRAEIEEMRERGILVTEPEPSPDTSVRSMQDPTLQAVSLAGLFSVEESSQPHRFLLGLRGPMFEERRQDLERCGVRLLEALPNEYYRIEVRPDDADMVEVLPFVMEVTAERALAGNAALEMLGLYSGDGFDSALARPVAPAMEIVQGLVPHDVWLLDGTDAAKLAQELATLGHLVIGADGQIVRVLLPQGSQELRAVKLMPGVEEVEEYVEPELHNAHARDILGLEVPAGGGQPLPWTGAGQIVGIADTGLYDQHPDFQAPNKLAAPPKAFGRPEQTNDPHGHGTHVAGTAVGDGTASKGQLKGAAPAARLYFQSVLGPPRPGNAYPLSGLPVALGTLFNDAYQAGARIHNNSWGTLASSYYRLRSREVDSFVRNVRRDMLIVISAGNAGTSAAPANQGARKSAPGLVDWNSLCTPATSKNALVVGASRSSLIGVGHGAKTHHQVWGATFPQAHVPNDVADEPVSGAAHEIAGFSSRGPSDLLQVKPDVVAPGTDIASARSPLAALQHYTALHGTFPNDYGHMSGTSMAAPLVSGCAALVREYLLAQHAVSEPGAALVKALLINGTEELKGVHATADPGGLPNSHQGFGRINMRTTLPNPGDPTTFKLHYFDNWQNQNTHLTMNDKQKFDFTLPAGVSWLRVCLAFTDLPGRGVQNSLLLQMHYIDGSAKDRKYGNEKQMPGLAAALHVPDRNNNVSIIRLDNPGAGRYVIQVAPTNMPFGGTQDFALVVSASNMASFVERPFNQ